MIPDLTGIRIAVAELDRGEMPPPERWLGSDELAELGCWRSPARRDDWLRGRYLAKDRLAEWLEVSIADPREIQILSRHPITGRGQAPRVQLPQSADSGTISLAHSDGFAAVAWSKSSDRRVGIDLVRRSPLFTGFLDMWFTERERQLFATAEPDEPLYFWAAKEALFKSLPTHRFQPRRLALKRRPCGELEPTDPRIHERWTTEIRTGMEANCLVAVAALDTRPGFHLESSSSDDLGSAAGARLGLAGGRR